MWKAERAAPASHGYHLGVCGNRGSARRYPHDVAGADSADDSDRSGTQEWVMPVGPAVAGLLSQIAAAMSLDAGISLGEAVARINHHWRGQDLSSADDLVLHEDATFWAARIYYESVPDWSPEADRSTWPVKAAPAQGSGC